MPRPKGSKNKAKIAETTTVVTVEEIESKMSALEAEIATLGETLKAKKAELKELGKQKVLAEKEAEERKAEADKAAILAAVQKSGKSIDEILQLINK